MEIGIDVLVDITMNVWSTMLASELCPIEVPDASFAREPMTSYVSISGAWEGAVALVLDRSAARALAARLFELEAELVSEDEVRDALGELANVCGGNFKALLPAPSYLSLPKVLDGDLLDGNALEGREPESGARPLGTERGRVVQRAGFSWEGQPFVVTVSQRDRS